jgi:enediyne biosynthesis protein E4
LRNGWLGLHLKGQAAGATIRWSTAGGKRSRLKTAGGSYLSANDPREVLGLGPAQSVEVLEVQWPDGHKDTFRDVKGGRYYALSRAGKLQ